MAANGRRFVPEYGRIRRSARKIHKFPRSLVMKEPTRHADRQCGKKDVLLRDVAPSRTSPLPSAALSPARRSIPDYYSMPKLRLTAPYNPVLPQGSAVSADSLSVPVQERTGEPLSTAQSSAGPRRSYRGGPKRSFGRGLWSEEDPHRGPRRATEGRHEPLDRVVAGRPSGQCFRRWVPPTANLNGSEHRQPSGTLTAWPAGVSRVADGIMRRRKKGYREVTRGSEERKTCNFRAQANAAGSGGGKRGDPAAAGGRDAPTAPGGGLEPNVRQGGGSEEPLRPLGTAATTRERYG
jgi:hypothetical protein